MSQEALPNFAQLNSQLAADNSRVNTWVDGVAERIDKLVEATLRSDWMEVKRLCQDIAHCSELYGDPLLAKNAERVASASEAENETEIKRGVIKLIIAAGRTRKSVN